MRYTWYARQLLDFFSRGVSRDTIIIVDTAGGAVWDDARPCVDDARGSRR